MRIGRLYKHIQNLQKRGTGTLQITMAPVRTAICSRQVATVG